MGSAHLLVVQRMALPLTSRIVYRPSKLALHPQTARSHAVSIESRPSKLALHLQTASSHAVSVACPVRVPQEARHWVSHWPSNVRLVRHSG